MHILIICKANFEPSELNFQNKRSYIFDQVQELRRQCVNVDLYFIQGKGIISYFLGAIKLRSFLKKQQFDVVHAHYGYSGLVAGLVSKNPVLVTYHGTDITEKISKIISCLSILLSDWNIFVSQGLYNKSLKKPINRFSVIPCGVDLDIFHPIDKSNAIERLKWIKGKQRILFSSSFSNPIKNVGLAKKAFALLGRKDVEFVELKNRTRDEVALMLNACDVLVLTSFSEGSPQIIKEALACNCPIVTTDVGDIKEVIKNAKNSYVTAFDPIEIAAKISLILESNERSNGSEHIGYLSNVNIVKQLIEVYHEVISNRSK